MMKPSPRNVAHWFVSRMIPFDKAIHFIAGNLTFIPILFLLRVLHMSPMATVIIGLVIVTALAIYANIQFGRRDRQNYHTSVDDVVYTLLGSLATIITYVISIMKV